jgi:hypothetical protein
MLRFPVAHPRVRLSIVCAARGRPTLAIESVDASLSISDWFALRSAIDQAWIDLDVLCMCGDSFVCHSQGSPHPCLAPGGCLRHCRVFTAAEPLYEEKASE